MVLFGPNFKKKILKFLFSLSIFLLLFFGCDLSLLYLRISFITDNF